MLSRNWWVTQSQIVVCDRSEEHTSELQSLRHLVCRLLLEKKKKKSTNVDASVYSMSASLTEPGCVGTPRALSLPDTMRTVYFAYYAPVDVYQHDTSYTRRH